VHAVRLTPLHEPPQVMPAPVQALRGATGAPETALHTPSEPGTLQASHWPVQVVSQQTPSTQWLLMH